MCIDTASKSVPKKTKSVYPTLYEDDGGGDGGAGEGPEGGKKRKREGSDPSSSSSSNFACVTSYRSIIHLGYTDGHLVSTLCPHIYSALPSIECIPSAPLFGSIRSCTSTMCSDPSYPDTYRRRVSPLSMAVLAEKRPCLPSTHRRGSPRWAQLLASVLDLQASSEAFRLSLHLVL